MKHIDYLLIYKCSFDYLICVWNVLCRYILKVCKKMRVVSVSNEYLRWYKRVNMSCEYLWMGDLCNLYIQVITIQTDMITNRTLWVIYIWYLNFTVILTETLGRIYKTETLDRITKQNTRTRQDYMTNIWTDLEN